MGWAYGTFGSLAWVGLGAYALVGALLVWLSIRLQPPTATPADPDTITIAEPAP
jgi:hypothetical protein